LKHDANEKYLDKNYGDVFIVWDKLFGTFTVEEEEPEYGLTKQLDSHSFLWQHFHFILEILYTVKQTKGFRARWKVIFGRPDYIDPAIRPRLEEKFLSKDREGAGTGRLQHYVVWQVGVIITVLFFFLLLENYVPVFVQVCITFVILLTLVNIGAILEQRRWVFYLEYARLLVGFIALYYCWPYPILLSVFAIVQLPFFLYRSAIEKQYLRLLYGRVNY
jgi:hypothetical protein